MTSTKPIVLYDIASAPPVTCFAPNPWKARYALNFKGAHYKTEWVDLPDIVKVRKQLGAAPNRKFMDGSDFYTLPIIKDQANNDAVVGDSFDIALYLDKLLPNAPTLCPPSTIGLHRAFNAHVDAVFTNHVILCTHGMPLNPETAEETKKAWVKRVQVSSWDDLNITGEERTRKIAEFEKGLGDLAKLYGHPDGPFLEGSQPMYADIIVGAWLQMLKATFKEWPQVLNWHDGVWKRLHEGLEKYAQVI